MQEFDHLAVHIEIYLLTFEYVLHIFPFFFSYAME